MQAYKTGRGSFRLRARWTQEDTGRGTYQIVVTEIPYQIPKARLVARIAELLQTKKLPLLADIRDESTEEVRLVLEPKSRTVDPTLLMESMFKLTELETRVPAQHECAEPRPGAERAGPSAKCCANGSTTARSCSFAARNSASPRSTTGSKYSTAI